VSSSTCSIPTETRIISSVIPAAARASTGTDACVMVHGCSMRDSRRPSPFFLILQKESGWMCPMSFRGLLFFVLCLSLETVRSAPTFTLLTYNQKGNGA